MSYAETTAKPSHPPHWNKHLSTFHELCVEVDGSRFLIGYIGGVSRSKAIRYIRNNESVRLGFIALVGEARLASDGDSKIKMPTVFSGSGYRVFYSGRTELEAWQAGVLPWVSDFAKKLDC